MQGYNNFSVSIRFCSSILNISFFVYLFVFQQKTGSTALMLAASNGHTEIVKDLVLAGANTNVQVRRFLNIEKNENEIKPVK
jgi:ankyrin repeat protein